MYGRVQDPSFALDCHSSVGVPPSFVGLWASCDGSSTWPPFQLLWE